MYFTPDWGAARTSLQHLADYAPTAAITGHGPPMRAARLQSELRRLASHFDEWVRPAHGRYRDRPAITNSSGVVDVPPPQVSARTIAFTGLAVGAAVGLAFAARHQRAAHRAAPAIDRAERDGTSALRAMPDDVTLAQSTELAMQDGGYDVTAAAAAAPPSTIDLR
jgi:hypothetical protein